MSNQNNKYGQNMVTAEIWTKLKPLTSEGQGLKFLDMQGILTFGELRRATSCFKTVFLTLLNLLYRFVKIFPIYIGRDFFNSD